MTRREEQVTTMGRIDIEEDSGNHDRLFFQQLFEESLYKQYQYTSQHRVNLRVSYQAIIKRRRQFLETEPDIECASRGDIDVKFELMKSLEDMVPLHLEVTLKRKLIKS